MALNAKKIKYTSGPSAPVLEADNYPARVVEIIDLGLQPQRPYKGQAKPPAYTIRVTYELPTEFMLDDNGNEDHQRPRWISEEFPMHPLSSELAKSTKRYLAIDPQRKADGDWSQLGGSPCLVAIVNNEKEERVFNNVGNVSPPVKGMTVGELVNPIKIFSLDDPDMEVFEALPDFLKEKIQSNLEFSGSALEARLSGGAAPKQEAPVKDTSGIDDDIPV